MKGPGGWQGLVVRGQDLLTPRLRTVIDREEFTLALALLHMGRRELSRIAEAPSRRLLHMLNLPAGSDITRVMRQIASLEREVREMKKALEENDPGPGAGSS